MPLEDEGMSEKIKDINGQDFDREVLDADSPVVVDFWAPWCGPCRYIAPMLDKANERWAGSVKIVKVNVDNNQHIAARYGVQGIPTLLFVDGGKEFGRQVGMPHPSQLDGQISQLVKRHAA